MSKLKAAFFGTPDFSVSSLKQLHLHPSIDLKYVVTMPDRPAGRGKKLKSPPVADYARENQIPLIQTENINREEKFLTMAKDLDFILVIAFAQFLGGDVLNSPRLGCFNIHTSLLPKYRGAAPIQYAILNGDQTTGVSIQKMVKKMDAGDIVFLKEVAIEDNETSGELFNKLQEKAASSLDEFLDILLKNQLNPIPQNESEVSFAPTIKKSDGRLDFVNKTSTELFNQSRAFHPWPGTYTFLNGLRLKVIKIEKDKSQNTPGKLNTQFGGLVVGTKEGSIRLSEVQLEGKKACSDTQLINGLKNKYSEFTLSEEIKGNS